MGVPEAGTPVRAGVHGSQLERLNDASNMALYRARAAVTDVHLLNAAPELAPLLSPRLGVQRLAECLIGAIVSASMPPPSAELPFDESVVRILARGTRLAAQPDGQVEPGHLMLALLQEPPGRAAGCLREVGVDIEAATGAISEQLRGGAERRR